MTLRAMLPTTLALLMALGALRAPGWAAEAATRNAAASTITDAEVKQHVGALADDTFEGRESGSRGNRAAGIYIIERLKKLGMPGGGPKASYYQDFGGYHNILGFVEGRDPALNDQVIVIGAHYDHVGYGSSRSSLGPIGFIHNGADDNASGVAALLEVADALYQMPERPRRSILFAFWDGEEKGLLGSQHWVEHPTVPLKQVPIALNADMVGRLRNDNLTIYGSRTSAGLRQLICRQNDGAQLALDFSWDMRPDSDHHSFYARNIPVLMMFTGLHSDYHRPSDDIEKINVDGLRRITGLMFHTLVELADSPSLAGFRRQVQRESRWTQQTNEQALPLPPGRLGIQWDEKRAAEGTIVITSVTAGSAAQKAGLRLGDKILKFDGREASSDSAFRQSVLAANSPAIATIERAGEASPRDVSIELAGEPVRLGISWRTDDAEPGCVIVNRVVPGSPADVAQIRVNDRIYCIDGQPFADGEEFRRLVAQARGTVTFETERRGRITLAEIAALKTPAVGLRPAADDGKAN